ncbi:MAG TPA: rhomboid family intramembrane serine protease [Polyangiaceae bacterium]|nr:rhomboid family intramembrane serine protease [Polyangiaceae bacterium]
MIPLRDDNPTRTVPFVTYLIIAMNVVVWGWQVVSEWSGVSWLTAAYGVVPRRLFADPLGEAFTIVSSMFMHGDWGHIAGNMLFLYVFGDNVEDRLGHSRYIAFYVLSGACAALAHAAIDPSAMTPMVGASGAIAGTLGAYMVLYPRAPIVVLNPIVIPFWFIFGPTLVLPAWLMVGLWFIYNLIPGIASIGVASGGGGVAFFAHIGGFLAGLMMVKPLCRGREQREVRAWSSWRPPPRQGRSPLLRDPHRRPRNFYDRDDWRS